MTIPLKPATKSAAKVLDMLVEGLTEPGQARKIDNTNGTFMAVHIECVSRTEHGLVYSVAHYYEANGDLVADPDMDLVRDESGGWHPLSITTAMGRKHAVMLVGGGKARVDEQEYRELLRFLSTWMKNIKQQQGL